MRVKIKYIATLIAVTLCLGSAWQAAGQHYLGVRAGVGGGMGSRTFPKQNIASSGYSIESATIWGLYSGGISWKYYTKEKYVGGTEVDVLFMQQGFKEISKGYSFDGANYGGNDSTAYYSRKVNSIVVPLMWQPHIYMFNRNLRVFLNAGVTFSYNISSTYEHGSGNEGVVYHEGKYPMKRVRDNRFGYGLVGGGGLGYSFGRIEFLAEVRYYIGYSDIRKNWNKYYETRGTSVNTLTMSNRLRSPLDNLQGSVALYYRFGQHGILSPPTPKVEQRLKEIEEKRLRRKGLWPPDEPETEHSGEDMDGDAVPDTDGEDIPADETFTPAGDTAPQPSPTDTDTGTGEVIV